MFEENEDYLKYKLFLSRESLKDLQQITEEKDLAKIMANALQLYYSILKYQVDNHKLAMLPIQEDGNFDPKRPLIFIKENYGNTNE